MSHTDIGAAHQPLGAGRIVSESFSIFFKNIIAIMVLGFVPILLQLVLSGLLVGWGTALGTDVPDFTGVAGIVGFVVVILLQFAFYGLLIAVLVQLAYDAKLERPKNIARYFSTGVRVAVPVIVLTMVVGILVGLGFMALLVPGAWLYAVFAVTVPAIVIERAGFGGMGRSRRLTKDYRWPVFGVLFVMLLCTMVLGSISAAVPFLLGGGGFFGVTLMVLVNALVSALSYGLSAIAVALIYARLREIKEGVPVDRLSEVFD